MTGWWLKLIKTPMPLALLWPQPSAPMGYGPVDNSMLVDEIAGSRPSTEQHSIDLDANVQDTTNHQCLVDTTQDVVADILSMFRLLNSR
jgi:hypothetical protein